MDELYDDAELYDLVSPPDRWMERFYREAVGGRGRRVLELACGTGRLTIPLAESGTQVVGADLSDAMLARARRTAAERGVAVEFVKVDMREFDLGDQRFDAAIIAANSLMHLHSAEDFAGAFASIHRYLVPSGRLAFDAFVPSAWLLSRPSDERQRLGVFPHPALGDVVIEETIAYNPASQLMRTDWYWSAAGRPDFRHTQLELRQIYPQELPLLLRQNGFELLARYGDFGASPFGPDSRRQVCVAVRV